MSKRNRPSPLKREREERKRQREAKKAERAAQKRARREGRQMSESRNQATDEFESDVVAADPQPETDDQ
ncbi:MAG: hypothetical protein JSU86_02620 [Phycisphaerales bacterium]|nr:MAG: hypothetical protein JSU86_02620 [Phycisphaerales bacterium]